MCGVGYKINAPTTEPNGSRKPYSVWKNMIHRCYSRTNPSYKFYGGRGVTVSEEWHCYDNFRKDMENLEGYNEDLFYENKLELDKDGIDKEVKTYSKETCRWVTRKENMSLTKRSEFLPHLTTTRLVALSPNDEEFCIINVPMFANEIGINKSEIYGTLSGNGNKTCRGWCFKKVKEFDSVNEINREEFEQSRFGVAPTKYEVVCENGEVIVMNSVKYVAEFLGCSVSLVYKRTRDGKEYNFKNYLISRKVK